MTQNKYKLTKHNVPDAYTHFYRIQALIDISSSRVKAGDYGGLVKSEANLSQENTCWIFRDACVYGNTRVYGDACVYGDARVYGNTRVYGDACVFGNACVTRCLFVQQFRHNITATDTHVFIGCEGHTWERWERAIEAIGNEHDYTEDEIEITKQYLILLKKQIVG